MDADWHNPADMDPPGIADAIHALWAVAQKPKATSISNLWVCDGSVFPTVGGVNSSETIQAIACRTADQIKQMAQRGEL